MFKSYFDEEVKGLVNENSNLKVTLFKFKKDLYSIDIEDEKNNIYKCNITGTLSEINSLLDEAAYEYDWEEDLHFLPEVTDSFEDYPNDGGIDSDEYLMAEYLRSVL